MQQITATLAATKRAENERGRIRQVALDKQRHPNVHRFEGCGRSRHTSASCWQQAAASARLSQARHLADRDRCRRAWEGAESRLLGGLPVQAGAAADGAAACGGLLPEGSFNLIPIGKIPVASRHAGAQVFEELPVCPTCSLVMHLQLA